MSNSLKKNLIKYGISIGISLLLAYVYIAARVDFRNMSLVAPVDLYLILCDAFTVPGMLFLMSGLLMTISNMGALDGLGYVAVNGLKMLIPGGGKKPETFKEYLERRRANRVRGYGFLYVTGLGCTAVSLVFMILFYSLYQR